MTKKDLLRRSSQCTIVLQERNHFQRPKTQTSHLWEQKEKEDTFMKLEEFPRAHLRRLPIVKSLMTTEKTRLPWDMSSSHKGSRTEPTMTCFYEDDIDCLQGFEKTTVQQGERARNRTRKFGGHSRIFGRRCLLINVMFNHLQFFLHLDFLTWQYPNI